MTKEISSVHHPLVKYWTKLSQNGDFRQNEKRVLLEGRNCIGDVCQKMTALRLIVTDLSLIPKGIKAEEYVLVTDQVMKKISSVKTPEGIVAELTLPSMNAFTNVKKIVVIDRIQDPGNLGTLIRSSLAFGWDGLFLLENSCDPFNDKALRAAKGATFHLPLYAGGWKELEELLMQNQLQLVVADIQGEAPPTFCKMPIALVLGNEAEGVNVPTNLAYRKVSIPMQLGMESLNVAVAGSILLYLYQEMA